MDRCAVCYGMLTFEHDHKPDQSGLDDGPPLPLSVINSWKRERAIAEWQAGSTLRDIAVKYDISHETVRVWTGTDTRKVGASRRPKRKKL